MRKKMSFVFGLLTGYIGLLALSLLVYVIFRNL